MNRYANKTIAELLYIQRDAYEAAQCAKELGNYAAECKYLDEVNDASTELYRRKQKGL
jgi:hypothetical protein